MMLSLAWKLDGGGVSFAAEIDGKPLVPTERRVRYSELESRNVEADRTVDVISQVMMDEMKRRSGTQN